jgi:hypothetical protein
MPLLTAELSSGGDNPRGKCRRRRRCRTGQSDWLMRWTNGPLVIPTGDGFIITDFGRGRVDICLFFSSENPTCGAIHTA